MFLLIEDVRTIKQGTSRLLLQVPRQMKLNVLTTSSGHDDKTIRPEKVILDRSRNEESDIGNRKYSNKYQVHVIVLHVRYRQLVRPVLGDPAQ